MKKLICWVAVSLVLVIVFGTIYVTVQQSERNNANYPQIQIAEDVAKSINEGDGSALLPGSRIDMAKSLAPFTIIYDKSGHAIGGTGYLKDKLPKAPLSMLRAANTKSYSAVTWEPVKTVRIAAVTVSAQNYFVLSGRSLTEVEKNETQTLQIALIGAMVSIIFATTTFLVITSQSY